MVGNRISALKARAFLRQIAEGAKASSLPLKQALINAQSSVNSPTFQKGRIVVSQSGSGQSGSFAFSPTGSEWTQDNIFALTEELLWLHDAAVTNGASADDADALFTAMCADSSLQGVRSTYGDFTALRYPVTR